MCVMFEDARIVPTAQRLYREKGYYKSIQVCKWMISDGIQVIFYRRVAKYIHCVLASIPQSSGHMEEPWSTSID